MFKLHVQGLKVSSLQQDTQMPSSELLQQEFFSVFFHSMCSFLVSLAGTFNIPCSILSVNMVRHPLMSTFHYASFKRFYIRLCTVYTYVQHTPTYTYMGIRIGLHEVIYTVYLHIWIILRFPMHILPLSNINHLHWLVQGVPKTCQILSI